MTKEELQKKADEMILAAAKEELRWSADDPRRDPVQWKRDLVKKLWEELEFDICTYT